MKQRRTADDFRADIARQQQQRSTPGDLERKQNIAANAAKSLRRLKSNQTYEDWRSVGQHLLIITEEVLIDLELTGWDSDNKKLTREFTRRFEDWERSVGSNVKPLTKQERWALREIMTEPKYHTWYSTEVGGPEQRKLNHPNAIINAYKRKHPDPSKERRAARQPSAALAPALSARDKKIEQLRARNTELEEELASRPKRSKSGKAEPLTIEQHQDALLKLLQDAPQVALMKAVNSFNARLQKTWKERRKKNIPMRAMTTAETAAEETITKAAKALGGIMKPFQDALSGKGPKIGDSGEKASPLQWARKDDGSYEVRAGDGSVYSIARGHGGYSVDRRPVGKPGYSILHRANSRPTTLTDAQALVRWDFDHPEKAG